MIKVNGIDHTCLWVRSLAEAKTYYEKVFGFSCKLRETDDDTLIVESGATHFFISENRDGDHSFLSRQHISFEVDSLDQVIVSLKALNITDYDVGEVNFFVQKNYKWCEWRDPSGIRLECVEMI